MASTINIATFEQITDILSKLATNYSNMALAFYNVFYNPTPMDVTIQMFDEADVLQTYVIPNRAKDRNLILNGEGNPEGFVAGSYGTIYQDTSNGEVFIKGTESGNTGWNVIVTKDILDSFIIHGVGNPEGIVEASKGSLYIDSQSATIYIKVTSTGVTGWAVIGGGDFSAANTSLSNITAEGQEKFDVKENLFNKVTSISSSSTNDEYPSAKCVYDTKSELEATLSTKEDSSNKVTSISSSSTNDEYPSAKCVYDVKEGINTTLSTKEDSSNKVTSISSSSTNDEYPSAKCVYDLVGDIETLLRNV